MSKPILAVDFDGVLHRYSTDWQGAGVVDDGPTPGAMNFLTNSVEVFDVHIVSSRFSYDVGVIAVQNWLYKHLEDYMRALFGHGPQADEEARAVYDCLTFSSVRPPAFVTLDDRAVTFEGRFPDAKELLKFKPWNKRYEQ